jgi:hypothetical protein
MVRIQEQRTKSSRWVGTICPNIRKKLNLFTQHTAHCHAVWNGKDGYEVKHFDHRFTVKLPQKTCSCEYWELSGLPCCHAIACIAYDTIPVEEYVADCYKITEFNKIYDHVLEPVEGMSAWPISTRPKPKAPGYIKMPGRPKKERTREVGEKPKSKKVSKVGTVIRCGKCKGIGHNKRKCDKINGTGQYAPGTQGGGGNGAQDRGNKKSKATSEV